MLRPATPEEARAFLVQVCKVFDVPPWVVSKDYVPTPAERQWWRMRYAKAARRARYERRYRRGRR